MKKETKILTSIPTSCNVTAIRFHNWIILIIIIIITTIIIS
jgi:hypothetical protein